MAGVMCVYVKDDDMYVVYGFAKATMDHQIGKERMDHWLKYEAALKAQKRIEYLTSSEMFDLSANFIAGVAL